MPSSKAISIRVSGKVQGVWFRKYTAEAAERLGIRGWVRNEPDGSVLIHAEAETEQLDAFLSWCHSGSPLSRVDRVAVEEAEEGPHSGFRIMRETEDRPSGESEA